MTETATTPAANAEQITYWNDVGGPKWVRYQALLDRQLEAIGAVAMDAASVVAGDAVLDVGCGCGSSTLALARRVLPSGRCTGVDISAPMLAMARQRAGSEGLTNATFLEADAQTWRARPEFDVLFSRFGVMFFDDPVGAFTNLHGAMRSGGRLAFVCWQALHRNPWAAVPVMAALKYVTVEMPSSPDAPGPFAFADAARVERILAEAGFGSINVEGMDIDIALGGGTDLDETVTLVMDMGPLARLLGQAEPEVRSHVADEVKRAIASYETPDGVKMPGAIWLVTARA